MGPSESPILLGDSFSEPLSGKSARVHGAFLQQDTVLPHAGGYRALLEASMLVAQMHVVKTLRQYQDSICEDLSVTVDRQRVLKAATEDMKKTLSIRLHRDMHWLQSLETQRDIALSLKSNGGKLGMFSAQNPLGYHRVGRSQEGHLAQLPSEVQDLLLLNHPMSVPSLLLNTSNEGNSCNFPFFH